MIFGWHHSYSRLLEISAVERLDVRRGARFVSLAEKMSREPRFASWFPLKPIRRNQPRAGYKELYKLHSASTGRYLNSPLNLMRRKLNCFNIDTVL